MKIDEYSNTIHVMIMLGLGPEPKNPNVWDVLNTQRIMNVAQILGGEYKMCLFPTDDKNKLDCDVFFQQFRKQFESSRSEHYYKAKSNKLKIKE